MRLNYRHSPEIRRKISEAVKKAHQENPDLRLKMSHPSSNKGKKMSEETKRKISIAKTGKPQLKHRGILHHHWKGGITPINHAIRSSLEYKLWRRAVFDRDNYTCIWCKTRSSKGNAVILHADHIKQFAYYPELRFAIDNGRTLCEPCHKKTDTFNFHRKK